MHAYLRAIGFSDDYFSEREINLFLDRIYNDYDNREVIALEDGKKAYLEFSKEVGPDMGICMCGEMDEYGFTRLHYFPYLNGGGVTTDSDISVDRKLNGHGYYVLVEDDHVGVSLIYALQNAVRLKKESIANKLIGRPVTTTLAGLSLSGMILLPVKKQTSEKQIRLKKSSQEQHMRLVSEARNGNQDAIESLTMLEMDNYAKVSRRLMTEDVYSIVETFFMPSGMECDLYQVMGTILFYRKVRNSYSKEYVYQLTIDCNDLIFDVCINAKDLLGDPEVGRRFKGHVWLQGALNFD